MNENADGLDGQLSLPNGVLLIVVYVGFKDGPTTVYLDREHWEPEVAPTTGARKTGQGVSVFLLALAMTVQSYAQQRRWVIGIAADTQYLINKV